MPRYQTGLLEQCIRDILLDILTEKVETQSDQPIDDKNKKVTPIRRGQVRDPSKDRRLKQNRQAA